MVQHLVAVVLFVLDWVEREVQLSEKTKSFNELQLEHLDDVIERKVEEAE